MKKTSAKNKKIIDNGWREPFRIFSRLSDADMELVETRLAASRLLRATREKGRLTQEAVAEKLHTSQSRLAKMEAGDSSVSLDLLFRSLFAMGVSRKALTSVF
ncbi:MAG: helix-turn-helix transcriptional regulator [Methylacidiphilales bacterium]|nr:helix-turn-helix transcriptional regulator [Candidatus Methylacidiphilales bacterium]